MAAAPMKVRLIEYGNEACTEAGRSGNPGLPGKKLGTHPDLFAYP
jgi:hypothetical protein